MSTTTNTATWTKLKGGDWGIRLTGSLAVGVRKDDTLSVPVTKKSGQATTEQVRVIWAGRNDRGGEVALAVPTTQSSSTTQSGGRKVKSCGRCHTPSDSTNEVRWSSLAGQYICENCEDS